MNVVETISIGVGMLTLLYLIAACIGAGADFLFKKHPKAASVLLCVLAGYSVVMFLKYVAGRLL